VYNSCFDNIFIGKYITYLPSCHSTNDIASELVQNGTAAEGDVVVTDYQTAGRGQRSARWESTPGLNLLFSVYLKPDFLSVDAQFYLSMMVCLGVSDFLKKYTSEVYIKWPNDIYIKEKKCCGILVENSVAGKVIKKSIVGIGLNINQMKFTNPGATSLSESTQQIFDLKKIFPELLGALDRYYALLKNREFEIIKHNYLSTMYGIGVERNFKDASGEFKGRIQGISKTGMLVINKNDGTRSEYATKEIEWL
jgi:BirA family biotin operon repressor/biotin-[acetyl-CoA-carboxylase] ligase